MMGNLTMRKAKFSTESWMLKQPLHITGCSFSSAEVVLVELEEDGIVGRGEAAGVYYIGDTPASMIDTLTSIRREIEAGADRHRVQTLLGPGGARNALDCALWDLEAKTRGVAVSSLANVEVASQRTVFTVGIGAPEEMANAARAVDGPLIKVKLDGRDPVKRIAAIAQARPDAELIVDVNQGWTFEQLVNVVHEFDALGVKMIEQPLPRGGDDALKGFKSPVPLCADESCLHLGEVEAAAEKYGIINIKLDKCGGLTEALSIVEAAKPLGLDLMVGNMLGTSLAMAPAFLVAQSCRYVDLDGATLLEKDRLHAMTISRGAVSIPSAALWG
jgi:L-alanine-DL-glutamate epimerase-like enolase superfamily enzyme